MLGLGVKFDTIIDWSAGWAGGGRVLTVYLDRVHRVKQKE